MIKNFYEGVIEPVVLVFLIYLLIFLVVCCFNEQSRSFLQNFILFFLGGV